MEWYLAVLKKYAQFTGRARRKEFWMFMLINFIIQIVLNFIDITLGLGVLSLIYSLAVLVPALAVTVRRLHDTGRSGFWLLIALIPIIGTIVLIVFTVEDSEAGDNAHGPNPKAGEVEVPPAA